MPEPALAVPDPRAFPPTDAAPPELRVLYALAEASLAAETRQRADALDHEIFTALARWLHGDGAQLVEVLSGAPSPAVARHLWRAIDAAWRAAAAADGAGVAVTVFALPIAIVTGAEGGGGERVLSGVLARPEKLAAVLGESAALAGNRTFTLANVLVAADAIDVARLPALRAWTRLPDALQPGAKLPPRTLEPAPIAVSAGREAVHLRFLVGTALAKPGADLLAVARVGKWGVALARELARELAADGVTVLALPRAPQRPLPAVAAGRAAQREVSAQIFAGNAIRKFRGTVGEPAAVISAHHAADAPGGGELRLSLSSPFAARAAEGFRCPLYPLDRVGDVVTMLVGLLHDCRVTDIRALSGVYGDRVEGSGIPLLFKPDTIPDAAQVMVH